MPDSDPLSPLLELPGVEAAAAAAVESISRAHRRPAGLRKFELISSESLMRGARSSVSISGAVIPPAPAPEDVEHGPLAEAISAYSLLAPPLQESTVRTFARAHLQVLARIDVAAGGHGIPQSGAARLQSLARLITHGSGVAFDRLLPVVVQAEIAAGGFFGPRSGLVAQVAGRVAAIHTGLDPRGFAVPEGYLNRHRERYHTLLADFFEQPGPLLEMLLAAWKAGGEEADAIARAV
ncbi:oxidoreductase [Corynebacterium flavescens]|uniref:oxidoreductase n=1 Tax=Corynebacterium flavescens TaxID=28028 RepID=UPI003FD47BD7